MFCEAVKEAIMRRTTWVWTAFLAALAIGGAFGPAARAEVRLPKVFGSHMVLQQEKPVVIWGWAQPNETITVQLGTESQKAQANERGEWKAVLPAMKAGGPYTLTVSASSTVRFDDVMVGEVWLCSGQSNMEMGIGAARDGQQEIAAADYPGIRLLKVLKRWTPRTAERHGGRLDGVLAQKRRCRRVGRVYRRRLLFWPGTPQEAGPDHWAN